MEMTSPDGRVADIPDAGVAAMTALGWKRVETPAPRTRTRTRKPKDKPKEG